MHPGSSHCVVVFQIDDDDSGYMTVMNPWGGFAHRRRIKSRRDARGQITELGWQEVLCYNSVWELSLKSEAGTGTTGTTPKPTPAPTPAPTPDAGLPANHHWNPKTGALTFPNGVTIDGGIGAKVHADILAGTWQGGYPDKPERKTTDAQGLLAFVTFGSCTLVWRPGWDAPRYATEAELSHLVSIGEYKPAA
jgi:hypothetical protein